MRTRADVFGVIGTLCHRYGPGRLPYADRRDVGGGLAMAGAGLLATVVWGVPAVAIVLAVGGESGLAALVGGLGLVVYAPLGPISAFVVGTAVWRYAVPADPRPGLGAVAGLVTAIGALLLPSIALGVVFATSNVPLRFETISAFAVELLGFSLLFFWLALLLGGWLVGTLGAFCGWYHERARLAAVTGDTAS